MFVRGVLYVSSRSLEIAYIQNCCSVGHWLQLGAIEDLDVMVLYDVERFPQLLDPLVLLDLVELFLRKREGENENRSTKGTGCIHLRS